MFNKISRLFDKYTTKCGTSNKSQEIAILTDNAENNIVKDLVKDYLNCEIKSDITNTKDFADSCIICILYENARSYIKILDFINECIDNKKTVILIVGLKFDFNMIVKESIANSIDAISWKTENGKKNPEYIIVMSK